MADQPEQHEKTEEPSQRKLDEAIRKGDVPKSQEVGSLFILTGGALIVLMAVGASSNDLAAGLEIFLGQAEAIPVDAGHLAIIWRNVMWLLVGALLVPMAIIAALGIVGNLVQHPLVLSAESLKPKASKISLIAGAKRLFSSQSLVNFGKSLGKLLIVGGALTVIVWPDRDKLDVMVMLEPGMLLTLIHELALKVIIGVVAIFAVIAGLDYLYQRHKWFERQRMTVKEVKDEYRQAEGDPAIKAKIRQIRMERGRQRMMAAVPEATVVVTNPTHYAVALKYESGMPAPLCVAKGVDAVALKIRGIALDHDVPVIENPPLARTLHAAVDVDGEIPPEHYKAVAQLIGYVLQLNEKRKWRRTRR